MKLIDGNNFISHYLKISKPFIAGKIGGAELKLLYAYLNNIKQSQADIIEVSTISGVQPYNKENVAKYANCLLDALSSVDALAMWDRVIPGFEQHICEKSECYPIRLHDLEPYYYDEKPWCHQLKGKNVLLISPFTESAKKQYAQKDKVWPYGLLPDFNLLTIKYPTSNLLSKNPVDKSIFDFVNETNDKIDKVDFDVAIIGAGAASLLLASHIKQQGRSAIHMGGATQILFGIRGNRWDNFPQFQKFFNEHWIRPSKDETPEKANLAESGCYW